MHASLADLTPGPTTGYAGSSPGLVGLAVLVGAGAGLGAVVFRYLILGFTELFTGTADYGAAGRMANPHLPGLGVWFCS